MDGLLNGLVLGTAANLKLCTPSCIMGVYLLLATLSEARDSLVMHPEFMFTRMGHVTRLEVTSALFPYAGMEYSGLHCGK
jgi:hypothetical protein